MCNPNDILNPPALIKVISPTYFTRLFAIQNSETHQNLCHDLTEQIWKRQFEQHNDNAKEDDEDVDDETEDNDDDDDDNEDDDENNDDYDDEWYYFLSASLILVFFISNVSFNFISNVSFNFSVFMVVKIRFP